MEKFKDFGSPELADKGMISFKLFDEEFFGVPALPGKILLDLVGRSGSDNAADQASIMTDFFASALSEESLERFNALIVDKERIVTTETLGEITGWLIEQYSSRPEEQPEV